MFLREAQEKIDAICDRTGNIPYTPEDIVITGQDIIKAHKDIKESIFHSHERYTVIVSPGRIAVRYKNWLGYPKRVRADLVMRRAWTREMSLLLQREGYAVEDNASYSPVPALFVSGWKLKCLETAHVSPF